jgi:AcrR family transcriptional regulator
MTERGGTAKPRRAYHSPARRRQAEATRRSMLAAARALFAERGYAGTRLEAIAEAAGVSPKTVVAAFGSKRGVLAEALDPAALGGPHEDLLAELRATADPAHRIALVARLTRQVYEASGPELELLRGAGAVAPDLEEPARAVEQRRWRQQERLVAYLRERDALRADRAPPEATDEIWMLTSFDVYRMLVSGRGWAPAEYEAWLARVLAERLLERR